MTDTTGVTRIRHPRQVFQQARAKVPGGQQLAVTRGQAGKLLQGRTDQG
jgi:hypothetical protein